MPQSANWRTDPHLTNLSVKLQQHGEYIGDQAIPAVPVDSKEFSYFEVSVDDIYKIPDTKITNKGTPNEEEWDQTEKTDQVENHGLRGFVPQGDIDDAAEGENPLEDENDQQTEWMLLAREKRASDLLFTASNYDSARKTTLSGTSRWSQTSNSDSTPLEDIDTARRNMLKDPNLMILGFETFTFLKNHDAVTGRTKYTSADSITPEILANLIQVDNVLVGMPFEDTAHKGQSFSSGRIWGKHASLHYMEQDPGKKKASFAYNFQYKDLRVLTADTIERGAEGGTYVQPNMQHLDKLVMSELGYFFENAGDNS